MKALTYLTLTRIKNSLKSFFKSPSRILLVLVFAGLFVMLLFTSGGTAAGVNAGARDIRELYGIVLGFYLIMFVILARSGLSNGASFFTMADVNNIFAAPFSQRSVLLYGLVRQLGTTFMMAFFLLYQYGWLNNVYGIGLRGIIGIVIGYMLTVYCSQLVAMGIYSYTSCDDKRRAIVSRLLYALSFLVLALMVKDVFSAANKLEAVIAGSNAVWTDFIPIAGWLRAFFAGLMAGDWLRAGLGLLAVAAFIAGFTALVVRLDADFYEDVLVATEASHSAITAQKEGRVAENTPRNVKVGKTGLGAGLGASALFFKHRVENRRSKTFLFDSVSLIMIALTLAFAYFLREEGIWPAFFMSAYTMIFTSSTGRWVRELVYPYVYLIPESPFKKLIMLCGESTLRYAAESAVAMIGAGLIVGAAPLEIAACVVCRFSLSLLFMASNFLTERLFGAVPGKALQVTFFFLVMIIIAIPGIVAGILVSTIASASIGLFAAAAWFVAVSALVAFLCRNILSNSEYNMN